MSAHIAMTLLHEINVKHTSIDAVFQAESDEYLFKILCFCNRIEITQSLEIGPPVFGSK